MKETSEPKMELVPEQKEIPCKEDLLYTFTKDEIDSKSKELARLMGERARVEDEKKSSASGFKSKLDDMTTRMKLLSDHINNGQEMREVECVLKLNYPVSGMKQLIRKDTNENVWPEPKVMTARESLQQVELFPTLRDSGVDGAAVTHSVEDDNNKDF